MSSSDLRRSMTATYDQEERRPQRRAPLRRQPRGPAHHAFKEEVTEKPAWVYPVLIAAAVVTASAIVRRT
jgi:negative regulator of sigma E activity